MSKAKATINIDKDLHWKLKIEAVKSGTKLSELVENLLREGLRKRKEDNGK